MHGPICEGECRCPEAELEAAIRATLTVFELTGDPHLVQQLVSARAKEHDAFLRFVRSRLERFLPRDAPAVASVLAAWPAADERSEPVVAP